VTLAISTGTTLPFLLYKLAVGYQLTVRRKEISVTQLLSLFKFRICYVTVALRTNARNLRTQRHVGEQMGGVGVGWGGERRGES
jgi:hypothetical protein